MHMHICTYMYVHVVHVRCFVHVAVCVIMCVVCDCVIRRGVPSAAAAAEHVSAQDGALLRHLAPRDGEMREHDHGVRGQESEARSQLHSWHEVNKCDNCSYI